MFSKTMIDRVWRKGKRSIIKKGGRTIVENENVWRKDVKDNKIRYSDYGKYTKYGWHVDHIKPKSKGGSNNIRNLQPLHWEANIKKGNKYRRRRKNPSILRRLAKFLFS